LLALGLLCELLFVQGRVRVGAPAQGARRIEHELARHGLKLGPAERQALLDSELQRARQLWQRRFGTPGADERERARQARFLAGRGFSAEVVHRVLRMRAEAPDDTPD
jgi:regulatory protein